MTDEQEPKTPEKDKKPKIVGLRAMRKQTARHPEYECSNCGCKRYSPCGCEHKRGK